MGGAGIACAVWVGAGIPGTCPTARHGLWSRWAPGFPRSGTRNPIWSSLVLGVATGLLWAPCAGPILGIIFTAAAIQGATLGTTLLLLAYALGAATSLALALLVGGKVYARMKGSLHATEWVRRVLGVLVIAGVAAIALGLDTRVLSKLSSTQTASLETSLAKKLGLGGAEATDAKVGVGGRLELPIEGQLPSLDALGPWINSAGLTREQLKGKVVLIDFWTYSCINCIRAIPYVRAWHDAYADDGLVVIGIHAPEFAFERNPDNVRQAVKDLNIRYPVALDNKLVVWTALKNRYWPAHYFFDAQGRQRYHHFGEGRYAQSEKVIRQLLAEAGRAPKTARMAQGTTRGAEAAAAIASIRSPETYVGYWRADRFVSPGGQAQGCGQDLCGSAAEAQRLGARRELDSRSPERGDERVWRSDLLPLPLARPASRAGCTEDCALQDHDRWTRLPVRTQESM